MAGIARFDPVWLEGHPDLAVPELVDCIHLTQDVGARVDLGDVASRHANATRADGVEEAWTWVSDSWACILSVMSDEGIPHTGLV